MMFAVSPPLERGDWIGVCLTIVALATAIIVVLWRSDKSAKQVAEHATAAIERNSNVIVRHCDAIEQNKDVLTQMLRDFDAQSKLNRETQQKLMEELLKRL